MRGALFLLLITAWGCNQMSETYLESLPGNWPYSVTYEVFVRSYYDSNGDGIGDINDLISRLDYIQELGVEAIWLMPVNPSPSYHKYDVTDYYGIDASYGTLDDFKRLIEEAHQRDLKIIMDLVINHCSRAHPWFKQALGRHTTYRDYFVWATPEEIAAAGELTKEKTGDSDNVRQWNEVPGQEELYFSFFWSGMPDLNYDTPGVREEVYRIGEYWLKEIGVDGFRLDAAKHIYPDHRAADNHTFWNEFKTRMQMVKRDVYLVGEVWADLPTQAPYAQGFTALFNFDLAFSIMETVKNGKAVGATVHQDSWKVIHSGSPVRLFNESEDAFKAYNPAFINTTFLTNHDQNRVMSFLEDDEDKARLAASILLTLPGAPYIYYGEEIGMRGLKPDENIREPMVWTFRKDTGMTSWRKPKYNLPKHIQAVDEQMNDKHSLYHHYKNLIHFRKSSGIMTFGKVSEVSMGDDDGLLAFYRTYASDSLLVIHNLSSEPRKITRAGAFTRPVFATGNFETEAPFVLPAFKSIILSHPN